MSPVRKTLSNGVSRSRLLLLLAIGLGLALRLWNLGAEPFWGDEVLSLDIAKHFTSVKEMLVYLSEVEFHPPLYYIFLHYWTTWFDDSELVVRLPSVICGLGSIVLVYIFGKRLFGSEKIGVIAAFIMAILPFQIEYSTEARPYAIFCFFGILMVWSVWEYWLSKQHSWLVLYVLSALVGVYLHYSYILILIATSLWWLFQIVKTSEGRSREIIVWLASHGLIGLGFSFWLDSLFYKLLLGKMTIFGIRPRMEAWQREPIFFERALDRLIWLNKWDAAHRATIFVKSVFKIAFVWLALQMARNISLRNGAGAVAYLGWLVVAILSLFLFMPYSVDYSVIYERHIIFATIPLALLMAYVFAQLPWKKTATIFLLFTLSLVPFISETMADDSLTDPDFQIKAVSEYINKHYQAGDLVIVPFAFFRTDAAYYLREDIPLTALLPTNHYGLDIWNSRHVLGLVENEFQTRAFPVTDRKSVLDKLTNLERIYRPKRIWLYDFVKEDKVVYDWFDDRRWRHAFWAIEPIFRLDLFVNPSYAVQR